MKVWTKVRDDDQRTRYTSQIRNIVFDETESMKHFASKTFKVRGCSIGLTLQFEGLVALSVLAARPIVRNETKTTIFLTEWEFLIRDWSVMQVHSDNFSDLLADDEKTPKLNNAQTNTIKID
jgi:hypothetical protein